MGYKYTMNPSSQRFTVSLFSIFLVYIFSESTSLKYHCTFSPTKLLTLPPESPHVHQRRPFANTRYRSRGLLGTNTCYYHSYRSRDLPGTSTCYYHSYRSPWLIRHHLLLAQLPVTWLSRHHLLPLTNPLDFPYQVTKYNEHKEWIRLFELGSHIIIQHINFISKHFGKNSSRSINKFISSISFIDFYLDLLSGWKKLLLLLIKRM
jgi:hypothetical protein